MKTKSAESVVAILTGDALGGHFFCAMEHAVARKLLIVALHGAAARAA
jgi:hypothetical protein